MEFADHVAFIEGLLVAAELANVAVSSAFSTESGLVANATIFRDRIRERFPNEFDQDGNRRIASGEYSIILKPKRERRDAQIDIWRHVEKWEFVRSLKVPPTKSRQGNGP